MVLLPETFTGDCIVIKVSLNRLAVILIASLIALLTILTYALTPKFPKYQHSQTNHNWYIIPEGDFENSLNNWPQQLSHQKNKFIRSADTAKDGLYSAKTNITNHHQGFAHISHPIAVEVGKQYTISAFFNTNDFHTGNLYIDLAETHNHFTLHSTPGQPNWQFKHNTFTAQASTVRIRIICDGNIKSTDNGYIDCIALTPTTEFRP